MFSLKAPNTGKLVVLQAVMLSVLAVLAVLTMRLLLLQSERFVFLIHEIGAAVMLEAAVLFVLLVLVQIKQK